MENTVVEIKHAFETEQYANDRKKIKELLESFPLYKKIEIDISSYENPFEIEAFAFSFLCPEDGLQTFKLNIEPNTLIILNEIRFKENMLERVETFLS